MSLKSLRYGFLSFFLMSGYVAINILLLQPDSGDLNRLAKDERAANSKAFHVPRPSPARLENAKQGLTVSAPSFAPPARPGLIETSTTSDGEDLRGLDPGRVGLRSRLLPAKTGNATSLVRTIQRELKAKGYDPGALDGQLGDVTRAAIFAYEFDNQLPLTASPSKKLLQTILLGRSSGDEDTRRDQRALTPEARELVLATQRALKTQGYWSYPVDGHFNTQLSRAIQQFETKQRLPTTGRISGRFMSRLIRVSEQTLARAPN